MMAPFEERWHKWILIPHTNTRVTRVTRVPSTQFTGPRATTTPNIVAMKRMVPRQILKQLTSAPTKKPNRHPVVKLSPSSSPPVNLTGSFPRDVAREHGDSTEAFLVL